MIHARSVIRDWLVDISALEHEIVPGHHWVCRTWGPFTPPEDNSKVLISQTAIHNAVSLDYKNHDNDTGDALRWIPYQEERELSMQIFHGFLSDRVIWENWGSSREEIDKNVHRIQHWSNSRGSGYGIDDHNISMVIVNPNELSLIFNALKNHCAGWLTVKRRWMAPPGQMIILPSGWGEFSQKIIIDKETVRVELMCHFNKNANPFRVCRLS